MLQENSSQVQHQTIGIVQDRKEILAEAKGAFFWTDVFVDFRLSIDFRYPTG